MSGINDMKRLQKEQIHNDYLHSWNYRGTISVDEFSPSGILSGDNWVMLCSSPVSYNGVKIYPGDMALALVDNPGELNIENIEADKWKLIRNQGVVGGVLVAKSVFYVDSENYNSSTKRLDIDNIDILTEDDYLIVKVNNASYNNEAFSPGIGGAFIVWKPNQYDAGFDLEIDDLIEVLVFRK